MTAIERIASAKTAAEKHIAAIVGTADQAPDAIELRRTELMAMKKDEIVARVLELEKPKNDRPFTVESIAKAILEDKSCAVLPYRAIAAIIQANVPDCKTSDKSLASYVTRHKDDWTIVAREKIDLCEGF